MIRPLSYAAILVLAQVVGGGKHDHLTGFCHVAGFFFVDHMSSPLLCSPLTSFSLFSPLLLSSICLFIYRYHWPHSCALTCQPLTRLALAGQWHFLYLCSSLSSSLFSSIFTQPVTTRSWSWFLPVFPFLFSVATVACWGSGGNINKLENKRLSVKRNLY